MEVRNVYSNPVPPRRNPALPGPVRVLTVTGGKGGVGKTNVAINLAISLIGAGNRVMLMDADLGLANVDVLLGMAPRYNLSHLISGKRNLEQIITLGPMGLQLIPASSGISAMASLNVSQQAGIIHAFSDLADPPDVLVVDTASGLHSSVRSFCVAAQEVVIVLCNDPASITDAYALIKVLSREHDIQHFRVLANMVADEAEARALFNKLEKVAERYLHANLRFLGMVPYDPNIRRSNRQQRSLLEACPQSAAARAFRKLAGQINAWPWTEYGAGNGLKFFMERLLRSSQRYVESAP